MRRCRGSRGRWSFLSRMRTCTRNWTRVMGRVRRCVQTPFYPFSISSFLNCTLHSTHLYPLHGLSCLTSLCAMHVDCCDRARPHRRLGCPIWLCARYAGLQIRTQGAGAGYYGRTSVDEHGAGAGAGRPEGIRVRAITFSLHRLLSFFPFALSLPAFTGFRESDSWLNN